MTHSTLYLYNITPQDLEGKEYFEALEFKKKSCKALYAYLYDKRRDNSEDVRMHYVAKALNHTENLLKERYAG